MPEVNLQLIKKLREKKGMSQAEMAQALRLKTSEKYTRRENGEYRFQASEIPVIATVLGVRIESLYK